MPVAANACCLQRMMITSASAMHHQFITHPPLLPFSLLGFLLLLSMPLRGFNGRNKIWFGGRWKRLDSILNDSNDLALRSYNPSSSLVFLSPSCRFLAITSIVEGWASHRGHAAGGPAGSHTTRCDYMELRC